MATLSEIVYSDGIRNINLIPFHYDKEAPFHRSEIIKNVIIFIPLGVYLKKLKIKGVKVILFGMDMHRAFDFYDFAFVFFQLGHLSNLNSHQINLKKS